MTLDRAQNRLCNMWHTAQPARPEPPLLWLPMGAGHDPHGVGYTAQASARLHRSRMHLSWPEIWRHTYDLRYSDSHGALRLQTEVYSSRPADPEIMRPHPHLAYAVQLVELARRSLGASCTAASTGSHRQLRATVRRADGRQEIRVVGRPTAWGWLPFMSAGDDPTIIPGTTVAYQVEVNRIYNLIRQGA